MGNRHLGTILKGIVFSSIASGCGGATGNADSNGAGGAAPSGGGGGAGLSAQGGAAAGEAGSGGAATGAGGRAGGAGGSLSGGTSAGGQGSGGLGAGGIKSVGGNNGLGGAFSGGSGGSGGGAGSSGSGGATSMAVVPLCKDATPLLTEGFNAKDTPDYVGLYLETGLGTGTLYQSSGSLCGGASNVEVCKAKVANALTQTSGFVPHPLTTYLGPSRNFAFLVVTKGDTVSAITAEAGLRVFLGSIDTPNEAALRLFLDGYMPSCDGMSENVDGYSETFGSVVAPCGGIQTRYSMTVLRDATVTATPLGMSLPCVGRRPAGLLPAKVGVSEHALGKYFASVAHLEAAAVRAFEVMIAELTLFDAPRELVERAKSARADEIRHAWEFGRLAAEHCAACVPLEVESMRQRPLLDVAIENAVEGVVRETWGALHAAWQAANVVDVHRRELFSSIAEDEAEHAALSRAVDDWIHTRLDDSERALVELEKRRALARLRAEITAERPEHSVIQLAGVPEPSRALDLFARLEAEFFAPLNPPYHAHARASQEQRA